MLTSRQYKSRNTLAFCCPPVVFSKCGLWTTVAEALLENLNQKQKVYRLPEDLDAQKI